MVLAICHQRSHHRQHLWHTCPAPFLSWGCHSLKMTEAHVEGVGEGGGQGHEKLILFF